MKLLPDHITTALIEEEVENLANARPDFVYPQECLCTYAETADSPRCIIGEALFNLGVPNEVLATWDLLDEDEDESNPNVGQILTIEGLTPSKFLPSMQFNQDLGESWGEALSLAKRKLGVNS